MSKKTVLLTNYEGHQYYPEYGTLWSDTWARFHLRRRLIKIGPTLLSKTALDSDREMFGSDPEEYGYTEPSFPEGDWQFCLPFGDVAEGAEKIPAIAINAEWVTKAGIEGAIGWYIRQRYGVTSEFRFRWRKNKSKVLLMPW